MPLLALKHNIINILDSGYKSKIIELQLGPELILMLNLLYNNIYTMRKKKSPNILHKIISFSWTQNIVWSLHYVALILSCETYYHNYWSRTVYFWTNATWTVSWAWSEIRIRHRQSTHLNVLADNARNRFKITPHSIVVGRQNYLHVTTGFFSLTELHLTYFILCPKKCFFV